MHHFKRTVTASLISLLFASPYATGAEFAQECKVNAFVENEVLIKLSPQYDIAGLKQKLNEQGADRIVQLFNVPEEQAASELAQWHTITLKKGVDATQAMQNFRHISGIAMIEPNYLIDLDDIKIPNDEKFYEQWSAVNAGKVNDTVDADADIAEAWALETGDKSVVVAVIDTGIDYNHPDLAANMWQNTGEIPDNNADDDGNGFRDDVDGWDFGDREADPIDVDGHGTHVAGIIGAEANNGVGISGVAWDVQLMPLKIFSDSGSASTSKAAEAIYYAAMNGADIINGSFSFNSESFAIRNAIEYARDAGILYVASASNDSSNNDAAPRYPGSSNLENIIAVGSSDRNDNKSSFSNFGLNSVDLFAPGSSVLSATAGGGDLFMSGTSQAAPLTAGVAALLKAQDSSRTYYELKEIIMDSVDTMDSLSGLSVTGGRLNAHNALVLGESLLSGYASMNLRGTNNSWTTTPMGLVSDNTWRTIATFNDPGNDNFKFDVAGDWSTNFGDNNADGVAEQGGGNISVDDGAGDYEIVFNSQSREYSITKLNNAYTSNKASMYLRSSLNSYKPVAMSLVDNNEWEVTVNVPLDGISFKFDVWGEWVDSYGDNDANGVANAGGSNIVPIVAPGNAVIRFNDQTLAYSVTEVAKSSTQSQMYARTSSENWNPISMTLVGDYEWQAVVNANNSNPVFKFDVHGNWSQNYGDNNNDGVADSNGGNIALNAGAGKYLLTFNDQTLAYSAVKVEFAKNSNTMHVRGTLNNWGATPMDLVADNTWGVVADFTGYPNKDYKFDQDGNWSTNYGDNNNDGTADQNGGNITVQLPGDVFNIILNHNTMQYYHIKR